jgi:hypothetical protein
LERTGLIWLLDGGVSSFGEERENYFAGRFPRLFAALKPWANFRSASAHKNRPLLPQAALNLADGVAQKARQVRDQALGVADGQTAYTKDTALNLVTYARDELLVENEGQEEALTAYGFNGVVGSAKNATPAAPKAKQFIAENFVSSPAVWPGF